MRKATLALASLMIVLSGCGGGGHSTSSTRTTSVTSATTLTNSTATATLGRTFGTPSGILAPSKQPARTLRAAHPCTPQDYYMQCASGAKGQSLGNPRGPPGASITFGLDFAWGGPSGSFARAHGARFAISYLSFDLSKDWSRSLLTSYRSAGLQVGFVWETGANRPLSGCSGGTSDAANANARLRSLGYSGAPVFFAADFDTSGYSTTGVVGQYYRCAARTVGYYRSGAYGGKRTVEIAAANGVRFLWQTLAWSYGRWDPRSCVRQTSIERSWFGYGVDYNLALCANWGQYGAAAPTPPGPPPAKIRGWRHDRDVAFHSYHANRCRSPQQSSGCRSLGTVIVANQTRLWTVYKRWPLFGPGARTKTAIAWVIRPEVSYWSRARDATRRAERRNDCTQHPRTALCGKLRQRGKWFADRASQTVRANS